MRITYHEGKRALTLADRGIDFADAAKVFSGGELTQLDRRRDYGEERYQTIGYLDGAMSWWSGRNVARPATSYR